MSTILGDPEALVAEVSRRAHQKAVAIEDAAHRKTQTIMDAAKQEAESIRRQSEGDLQRQMEALTRRNTARADLEAQRRFILLREAPIDRVWREAEQRLRELVHQPGYVTALHRLALEAARELDATELELAADSAGHQLLSAEILEDWSKQAGVQFRRAPHAAAAWGGLIATNGRRRFDATFPARLEQAQLGLRERVFDLLSKGNA